MGLSDRDYMRESRSEAAERARSERNQRLKNSFINLLIVAALLIGIGYPVAKRVWNWGKSPAVSKGSASQSTNARPAAAYAEAPASEPAGVAVIQSAIPRAEAPPPASRRLVNLNTATAIELESLPRIGAILAKRIIESRPYGAVDDLRKLRGFSPRLVDDVRPAVTVGENQSP
jgi:DNA uptake protein ComE-like DNA-binding protein